MSDNVPLNLRQPHLNLSLPYIPTEVWTDVFKLFSRRTLVQHVQPVNYRFKEICNKNVKSVHVIEWSKKFLEKLSQGDPEANQQLEDLAGNKCELAEHFRLNYFSFDHHVREEAKQTVLRHCLDLFRDCRIFMESRWDFKKDVYELTAEQMDYLTLLEPTKPGYIYIQAREEIKKPTLDKLLLHPTILNCPRLELYEQQIPPRTNYFAIFNWLHHMPVGEEASSEAESEPEMRCFFIHELTEEHHKWFIEWFLVRCVQNFQRSQLPPDRRNFVVNLKYEGQSDGLDKFKRIQNPSTGEVLLLEHVEDVVRICSEEDDDSEGVPSPFTNYRLLRCSAKRVADGTEQLFGGIFRPINGLINGADENETRKHCPSIIL